MTAVLLLIPLLLTPAMGIGDTDRPAHTDRQTSPCVHPWPCGGEWPADLEGPFERGEVQHVRLPSHDGAVLAGTIVRPRLPDGVGAPVVLSSSPYWSINSAWGGHGEVEAPESIYAVPVDLLVSKGYAVAGFNVRGTGDSGGCFDIFGANEQRDQEVLVEWLAAQAWSNGRVATWGASYPGTTAMQAAVQAPEALKAVVAMSFLSDYYLASYTPQGAAFDDITLLNPPSSVWNEPRSSVDPDHLDSIVGGPALWAERACPEARARYQTVEPRNVIGDSRDGTFYEERRLVTRFPAVTAAVLLTGGFQDTLTYMDDIIWDALTQAPKTMMVGNWDHDLPIGVDWPTPGVAWLEFWLKGLGEPPASLGLVRYEDDQGGWHRTASWPPSGVREEVLHLRGDQLATRPGEGDVTFHSVPDAQQAGNTIQTRGFRHWFPVVPTHRPPCPHDEATGTRAIYTSAPLQKDALLAGNPMAHLRLTSDGPGGIVGAQLFEITPGYSCIVTAQEGHRFLTEGAADLRFHKGNMEAEAFPIGTSTSVRIDMQSVAEVIEEGNRLVLVVSFGPQKDRLGQGHFPTITVEAGDLAASHLVLPLVDGTLGGKRPRIDHPPRPFDPMA